jgi:hypothetical protein
MYWKLMSMVTPLAGTVRPYRYREGSPGNASKMGMGGHDDVLLPLDVVREVSLGRPTHILDRAGHNDEAPV